MKTIERFEPTYSKQFGTNMELEEDGDYVSYYAHLGVLRRVAIGVFAVTICGIGFCNILFLFLVR